MGRSKLLENYLLILLAVCAATLAIAIIVHLLAFSSEYMIIQMLHKLGNFLFSRFHLAAFLIAAYPLFAAALFLMERSPRALLLELILAIVPLLFFSVAIHLLVESPVSNSPLLTRVGIIFGKNGGIIVMLLLTAAAFALIIHLGGYLRSGSTTAERSPPSKREKNNAVQELYRTPSALRDPPPETAAERQYQPRAQETVRDAVSSPHNPTYTEPPTFEDRPASPQSALSNGNEKGNSLQGIVSHTELPQHAHQREDVQQSPAKDIPYTFFFSRGEITSQPPSKEISHSTNLIEQSADKKPQSPSKEINHSIDLIDQLADKDSEPPSKEINHSIDLIDQLADKDPESPSKEISRATGTTLERGTGDVSSAIPDSVLTSSNSTQLDWNLDANKLLKHYPQMEQRERYKRSQLVAEKLRKMLQEFNIEAEIVGIQIGPVVTVYEVLPAPGVKVTKVSSLSDNIALRLAAPRVRIEAPIPGKQAIGIEIPNKKRQVVGFDQLVSSKQFRDPTHVLPIALGKGISGEPYVIELAEAPHLMIAGATGSGKSVCINSIICSLIFHCAPQQIRMMLVDTKIVELKPYNNIPHLLTPVITDPRRALQALEYCVREMEQRYSLLDELSVRDISSYNRRVESSSDLTPLPYIVVIIDELADLMLTAGKKIETLLVRLAAMSRAVGIHLVLATQRPSADVITGLIKANIPSRISFMVSSKIDARIVLDISGAEQLLGKGDMLYVSARHPHPLRIQGALVTDEEVLRIAQVTKEYASPEYVEEHQLFGGPEPGEESNSNGDHLFEEAVDIVRNSGKASASYLQRRLQIGYNRAARLIEEMERQQIVGSANGSKPREIIKAH